MVVESLLESITLMIPHVESILVSKTLRLEKMKFKKVFTPGFSSRKRGWGLGLTLSKRIVEGYHGGKIFVKQSELGKGTTFRILLLGPMEEGTPFLSKGILDAS